MVYSKFESCLHFHNIHRNAEYQRYFQIALYTKKLSGHLRTIKNIRITLYALVIYFSEEAYFMAWDSPVWQHKILDKYNFMKKDIFIDIDVYSRPEGDIQGVDFDETN